MTDNPHNFIPHDRMSKQGKPNKALIAYNARRYQLNQIAIHHEVMPISGSVEQLTNWYKIGRVIGRLQRLHMGTSVTLPNWSQLIQVKE